MININRTTDIPASLQLPEIQTYLDEMADYWLEPAGKTKPKHTPSYRNSDVVEAFDLCFFSKCYLTERKFANSFAMDIDHFIPKNEKPKLCYQWTNLYPADGDANNMRFRKTPEGGYLDPCAKEDDVEFEIIYALAAYGNEPRFDARDKRNNKAINTAGLLMHLHNGSDENTTKKTATLRFDIKRKYDEVMKTLAEWLGAKSKNNAQEEFEAREELRLLLSRKASFTMLMRAIPSVRRHVPPDLLD